ncbi:MAG: alpha-L-fucosidase [Acidobacteria bacterium]|nr:alpha-L-fucosidase [Acidobacteriota bacterium]
MSLVRLPTMYAVQPSGMAEFQQMKYGFFVHYVWGGAAYLATINKDGSKPVSLDDLADRFNANRFADDLAAMKVEYVVFTPFHADMNALYPSKVLNEWLPGHASKRDLLRDMIRACKAKGISVLFYTHPRDGHDLNVADQSRTGWVQGKGPILILRGGIGPNGMISSTNCTAS